MHSCIYEGRVRHRRFSPVHAFGYRLFLMYLDLSELDEIFRRRWLWSVKRPNLARFRREDHLGDSGVRLDAAVRDLVHSHTGSRPDGPIRLLTNLRYFGYVINPVSFYYCFDKVDRRLEAIVAEVTNTPWGERHCYVLSESNSLGSPASGVYRFGHDKEFHVSPFMGMDMHYRWRISEPGERLDVHIENFDREKKRFEATLALSRREITGPALARMLLRYPFATAHTAAAIYWQALKLWWKGAHFFPHPKKTQPSGPAETPVWSDEHPQVVGK